MDPSLTPIGDGSGEAFGQGPVEAVADEDTGDGCGTPTKARVNSMFNACNDPPVGINLIGDQAMQNPEPMHMAGIGQQQLDTPGVTVQIRDDASQNQTPRGFSFMP
ncbi:hypothetical protein Salat_1471400 [Sesamum alatum]|uniref:Uncharacterized protein n=1 Tax=Sesamum alatum TaxID=300844 RepID=A0AAE2CLW6_9LAMI|nr:hypothetical protein Salat_1471400 [Sesamum alatum]